jgi:hypothetical protein
MISRLTNVRAVEMLTGRQAEAEGRNVLNVEAARPARAESGAR